MVSLRRTIGAEKWISNLICQSRDLTRSKMVYKFVEEYPVVNSALASCHHDVAT
jgi:hypothetical protein